MLPFPLSGSQCKNSLRLILCGRNPLQHQSSYDEGVIVYLDYGGAEDHILWQTFLLTIHCEYGLRHIELSGNDQYLSTFCFPPRKK
ncbi:hypothetical protein ACFXTN_001777 [Malus domestica]